MVRHDSEGAGNLGAVLIVLAGKLLNGLYYAGEGVGIVYALNALKGGDGAVEPHTGIDVVLSKGEVAPVRLLVVLHENVVPYLQVLAAVTGGVALGAALRLAGVVEYFGIGAAGAGDAGGTPPVMLFVEVEYVGRVYAHLYPAVVGIGVPGSVRIAREAGEVQLVLIYAKPLVAGEKLPGVGYGFLFEVIPQGPVAQHLEEGAVGGIAHLVYIAGADTLLNVRKAGALRVLCAHEVGNEGVHARGGKKHRGVIFGYKGGGRDYGVALFPEKVKVKLAKLG